MGEEERSFNGGEEKRGKICGIYQLSICFVQTMREKWMTNVLIKYMFGKGRE